MPSVTHLLALAALICLFAAPVHAEDAPEVVVERREGPPVRGRLIEFEDGRFKVLVGGQLVEVHEDDVREVRFASAPAAGGPPADLALPAGPPAATPEAVYRASQEAIAARRWADYMACLTPEARRVAAAAIAVSWLQALPSLELAFGGEYPVEEVRATLARHGVPTRAPVELDLRKDADCLQLLRQVERDLQAPVRLLVELYSVSDKLAGGERSRWWSTPRVHPTTLREVRIEGDSARAEVVTATGSSSSMALRFRRTPDGWRIDVRIEDVLDLAAAGAPARQASPALDVVVTAPIEGAELASERVEVSGQVSTNFESSDLAVTVNGTAATISSDRTFTAQVTLPVGEAAIDVVARASVEGRRVEGRARRRVIVSPEDERLFAHAHRTGDARAALDGREGGTAASALAVRSALEWLLRHQSPDGRWDADGWTQRCPKERCSGRGTDHGDARYDVGLTSLVLLAFAADGQTHRFGPARAPLARAVSWLLRQQREDGSVGFEMGHGEAIYNHALATQALCELAAMSPDEAVLGAARRAVDFCLVAQNPGLGWKYGVKPGRNDTSVTGTMVMALVAARTAGIEVPDAAFDGARRWFALATDANGATGYESPGGGSSYLGPNDGKFEELPCMTALAVACRLTVGDPRADRSLRQGLQHVLASLPPSRNSVSALRGLNYLYYYYGTAATFQAGGEAWQRWSAAVQPALVSRQRADGCAAGSWDGADEWALAGGRIYATAVNALSLQAPHRYERRE